MARTIGRKYKNQIIRLVKEANSLGIQNAFAVAEYVKDKLPQEAFDTWEMAYQEIERFTEDYVFNVEVK